jgi:hypothetical protein
LLVIIRTPGILSTILTEEWLISITSSLNVKISPVNNLCSIGLHFRSIETGSNVFAVTMSQVA